MARHGKAWHVALSTASPATRRELSLTETLPARGCERKVGGLGGAGRRRCAAQREQRTIAQPNSVKDAATAAAAARRPPSPPSRSQPGAASASGLRSTTCSAIAAAAEAAGAEQSSRAAGGVPEMGSFSSKAGKWDGACDGVPRPSYLHVPLQGASRRSGRASRLRAAPQVTWLREGRAVAAMRGGVRRVARAALCVLSASVGRNFFKSDRWLAPQWLFSGGKCKRSSGGGRSVPVEGSCKGRDTCQRMQAVLHYLRAVVRTTAMPVLVWGHSKRIPHGRGEDNWP
eukprot:120564-Chlamydomonas_euryale.AAC.1